MPEVPFPISRVTRSKRQAMATYDRLSRWYDLLAESSERRFRDRALEKLAAKEGERVLEIGFGTGAALVAMARAVGGSGMVCGIDLSFGMCRVARARVRSAGLPAPVHLLCADAVSLPFAGASFEALFMSFTLELFDTPEIPRVLAECRRVLRPDGRLCVVSLLKPDRPGLIAGLYEWAHAALPSLIDCRPIFVRHSLEDAGFQPLDLVVGSMWGLPVAIVLAAPHLRPAPPARM